jgi:hypothetical protein
MVVGDHHSYAAETVTGRYSISPWIGLSKEFGGYWLTYRSVDLQLPCSLIADFCNKICQLPTLNNTVS